MCGGDHYRNARILAEEATAITEEMNRELDQVKIIEKKLELSRKLKEAFAKDTSHTKELSKN